MGGKTLILAEKPSVARHLASALGCRERGDGFIEGPDYVVTWAMGHLLELKDMKDYDPEKYGSWRIENYPFIPESFGYKVAGFGERGKAVAAQFRNVKKLLSRKDVGRVISATDSDREGQLIADTLFDYIGVGVPVYRLLLNEWTEDNIRSAIGKVIPNSDMDGLKQAGLCRQRADWLIGINLTALATLQYARGGKGALRIGRVINPTLKLVYDRDMAIKNFKPEKFYRLEADFEVPGGTYHGVYRDPEGNDRFKTEKELSELLAAASAGPARIVSVEDTESRQNPQPLFNQTNLQGELTSKHSGWTSDKVLSLAQSLYEKQFLTYPRTASRALEESQKEDARRLLEKLVPELPEGLEIRFRDTKRVFDDKKVESHGAIIPTRKIPKEGDLTADERKVYEAVRNRFAAQFMPPAVVAKTKAVTESGGVPFVSTGKRLVDEGYMALEGRSGKDSLLPPLEEGMEPSVSGVSAKEGTTKPPSPMTEKDLLHQMETCGRRYKSEDEEAAAVLSGFAIGTDATRAATIKKLNDCGYIERKGKQLHATGLGCRLVETFPVKELFDLEFTGRLEYTLKRIERGEYAPEEFMDYIARFLDYGAGKIKADDRVIERGGPADTGLSCPLCGRSVREFDWGWGCSGYKEGCKFSLSKTICGKKLTKAQAKALMTKGKTGLIKGFKSKKGKSFDAKLRMEDGRAVFDFGK